MTPRKAFIAGLLAGIVVSIIAAVFACRWFIYPRARLVATRTVRLVDDRTGTAVILPPGAEVLQVKKLTPGSEYEYDGLLRFKLDPGDTALQDVTHRPEPETRAGWRRSGEGLPCRA